MSKKAQWRGLDETGQVLELFMRTAKNGVYLSVFLSSRSSLLRYEPSLNVGYWPYSAVACMAVSGPKPKFIFLQSRP